jgi:mono/diheme cytochrome c family protein
MIRHGWASAIALGVAAWGLAVTLQAGRGPAGVVGVPAHVAPARLADTGFYAEGRPGEINPRNRPFGPQYPLWTDGLEKRRWVFLPEGATIDAADEHAWDFPVGTRFWKEFSRGGRPVETRFSWRTASGWVYASYQWNEDGTEAVLAAEAGVRAVVEVAPGRAHSIPSQADCAACHGTERPSPLGFTALQLSPDRDPNALHAEALEHGMLTLDHLIAEGRLTGARGDLLTVPPRIRTSDPRTRTVLGYLASNCGACHNGRGEIAAFGPTIRVDDLVMDGDAVARGLINQRTKWQIPGVPDGESVLVQPGVPERSAIAVRMRSRQPSSQMPPLGTVVRDEQALDLFVRWIGAARE